MSWPPLNNVTTANEYAAAATVVGQAARVTVDVANAAIYLQLADEGGGNPLWRDELFVTPGFKSYDRVCAGARVRSAVAGKPAQVTLELVPAGEIGA